MCYATADAAKAACGSACVACAASATGSLQVEVTGLPQGTGASLTATGPGGYSQALTGTQTLTGLSPGTYLVRATLVRQAGATVDVLYDGAGCTAVVAAGATASCHVTYSKRPGTGSLWTPVLSELGKYQLEGSTTLAAPEDTVLQAIAFDAAGNMWVSDSGNHALYQYTPAQLATGGNLAPAVTIGASARSLSDPMGLAFDLDGNLWVANSAMGETEDEGSLAMFSPAQLAATGKPTPAVTIKPGTDSLHSPVALAFDAAGDLWVANFSGEGGGSIVKFAKGQLGTTGAPSPRVKISQPGGLFPMGVAFDRAGSLWVTPYWPPLPVMKFTPAQLATSGSPTPSISISTFEAGGVILKGGLAFDSAGDLWVYFADALSRFLSSQLGASGDPLPGLTYEYVSNIPVLFAFDPPPADLPFLPPR
jgi:sugar lactone lactonase YvrE